jgi:hypothetical protein
MREHLCIRREEWVAGTATQPEVGVFTQTSEHRRPVPWGRIGTGEVVWMKWSAGLVVAKAVVDGFRQFTNCSARDLRLAVSGFALHDLEEYWSSRPPLFYAMAVYLKDEEWLDKPLTVTGQSNRSSWIVFPNAAERERWMSVSTEKAERILSDPRGSRVAGASLRFRVFRRDSFTCRYCGRKAPSVPLHVDHIKPWSSGGRTELANLVTACSVCNLGKGDLQL